MRIVFQGSMTPNQLGSAVSEIIKNTLSKMETVENGPVEAKRHFLHNPVVETNLNIKGHDGPTLLVDEEKGGVMYQVRTGYKNGEFVDYEEVDRSELIEKFNELVDHAIEETEKDPEA